MTSPQPNVAAHRLLDAFLADPGVSALDALLRWLMEASPDAHGPGTPRTRRLELLAELLRSHPRQTELLEQLRAVWTHGSTVRLLAETGLPVHVTLVKESLERLVDGLIPRQEPEDDLYVLLSRLRLSDADADWVESLTAEVLAPWRALVALPDRVLLDAARLVAFRTAAVGLARELLELEPTTTESQSPFFRLPGVVERLAAEPHQAPPWGEWLVVHDDCHAALAVARARLELRGVSTDLIYRMELLEAQLLRLQDLLSVATGHGDAVALAGDLIRGTGRQRGIRSLARNALKRLARKVVEHTGETGDHYVVHNRKDWADIGRTAGWAGILTAFTALGKYALGGLPLAPMVLGLGLALNYTASFILLQLWHLTLASKQPAMTAAALAGALEQQEHLEEQVELVAGITRSQVIATIGNVLVTLPASLALVALSWLVAGQPLLGQETAGHTVHGMHPFLSWTGPFAVLTGGFLWLSSLASGWAANWSAYRGLPTAIARHHGLRRALGPERAERIGRFIEQHFSGIVGYIALGFLLGYMPVAFQFMGLPIEVRHVTLNAASLAIGAGSLYGTPGFHWADVVWGLGGVVLMGVCNFGVSFALALRTAMRARDLGQPARARLWSAIRQAFAAKPSRFLWRPRAAS